MAGSSMKDINTRIKSISSTKQITKAMELVAASKLQKAKMQIANSRDFHIAIYNAMSDIIERNIYTESPYLIPREVKKSCYVVIGGDRGLAGGYNGNVFRLAKEKIADKNVCVLPIGKRTTEYFRNLGFEIVSNEFSRIEDIDVSSCHEIADLLTELYKEEEFDEVFVVFTHFVSLMSQQPGVVKILPMDGSLKGNKSKNEGSYISIEPSSDAVFNSIVPSFIAGMMWGSVNESLTSEYAARRIAMESATKNAEEIIDDLSLRYNRARQGSITQEITEIIAGSGI